MKTIMNSPFFSFFVFYFLVGFVAVVGIFWQDARFFWLAAINFVALCVFFVAHRLLEKKQVKTTPEPVAETPEKTTETVHYPHHFVKYPYGHKQEKSGKKILWYALFFSTFLFLLAVVDSVFFQVLGSSVWVFAGLYLFMIVLTWRDLLDNKIKVFGKAFGLYTFLFVSSIIISLLAYSTLSLHFVTFTLLLSLLLSFFFFVVGYVILHNGTTKSFFKLFYTKVYIFLLVIWLGWLFVQTVFYDYSNAISKDISFFTTFFDVKLFGAKKNTDPFLFTGQGEILSTGINELFSWDIEQLISSGVEIPVDVQETWSVVGSWISDVFLGTGEIQEATGELEQQISPSDAIKQKLSITDDKSMSMLDGIVYLFDVNSVVLSSKKDTSFAYITKQNPYYAYWKTAYDKKLIGSSNNPSKLMLCETYITLKGMIEWWNVKYSAATVKSAFWTEAKKRNELNGCVVGKVVKGKNL